MAKVIVSLSGGMDSATVLTKAIEDGYDVDCVGFSYGSKHNQYENAAANRVAKYYDVPFDLIRLDEVLRGFASNLLKGGGDIPEGHYESESMSQTVVPGRNLIFAAFLVGLAWSRDAEIVYLGIHGGDHAIYPDCRPGFFHALNAAVIAGSDDRVRLEAPFLHGNKESILGYGLKVGTPYWTTRTCYKDQPIACGKCGSCQERLEAFRLFGDDDPIEYETRGALA